MNASIRFLPSALRRALPLALALVWASAPLFAGDPPAATPPKDEPAKEEATPPLTSEDVAPPGKCFIAEKGEKWHSTRRCRTLRNPDMIQETTIEEAVVRGEGKRWLEPCKLCGALLEKQAQANPEFAKKLEEMRKFLEESKAAAEAAKTAAEGKPATTPTQ